MKTQLLVLIHFLIGMFITPYLPSENTIIYLIIAATIIGCLEFWMFVFLKKSYESK